MGFMQRNTSTKFRLGLMTFFLTLLLSCSSGLPPVPAQPLSLTAASLPPDLLTDLPRLRTVDLSGKQPRLHFPRFGQCQFILPIKPDLATGLHFVPAEHESKINQCLDAAVKERINVLILPELSLAFPKDVRARIIDKAQKIAAQNNMVIIAGSFYDSQQFSRIAVISPQGLDLGYKIRASRFEASPGFGLGMTPGESLLVLHTPYGRLAVITCVDLISDAVQYVLRNLATRGEIDVIININYNPAAWEFLVEANSIARRHPVFVSITNVAGVEVPGKLPDGIRKQCFRNGQLVDNGSCYGNSALFGGVRTRDEDYPNCLKAIESLVGDQFKVRPKGPRSIPYDTMLANLPPFEEAMLVYELNLRLKREPAVANAPDEGYPTVRGLRKIPLQPQALGGLPGKGR